MPMLLDVGVIQDSNPGAEIGVIRERISETDIGLIQLHDSIKFENKFMGTDHEWCNA
jgi:hypothetical protein